jgi:4-hydroxy-2-oxoglutarate aldolase
MTSALSLVGLFPPIPTPFTKTDDVDYPALEANLSRWNEQPLSGLVVGGSNGEFVHLTDREKSEVVQFVRQHTPPDRVIIAGTGELSTRKTVEMTSTAADAGAQAALVVTPYYYKGMMTHGALVNHYLTLAEQSPIPILLYSVPANTGLDLASEVIIELSSHPNIIGLKDSGGDVAKLGKIIADGDPGFQVLAGSGGFFLGALAVGAVGTVAALANIAASRLHALQEAFNQGKLDEAGKIQRSVIEINEAVTRRFGVAGLKAAMDLMGMQGGMVRQPLLPLDSASRETLRLLLQKCGLLP